MILYQIDQMKKLELFYEYLEKELEPKKEET